MIHNCIQVFWADLEKKKQQIALEINDESYTYELLAEMSKRIASVVEKSSKSKIVAILSCKELLTYSSIIGVMSGGRAYCPIGHKLPTKRQISVIIESSADTLIVSNNQFLKSIDLFNELNQRNSNITIIIDKKTTQNVTEKYPNLDFKYIDEVDAEKEHKVEPVTKDTLAYLFFTSGTTGKPKGVPITHGNLSTYLNNIQNRCDFDEGLRYSQTFPLTFDLSVHDIFVCWMHNGCLIPIPDEKMISPAEFINSKKIQVWFSVPSQISLIKSFGLLQASSFRHIRLSLFCGEALPLDLAQSWMAAAPNSKVVNLYGPTEATIAISVYELPESPSQIDSVGGVVSIGKIFEDHQFQILHDELIITGNQIAGYYWGAKDNSSGPFSCDGVIKSYKTGDMVEERGGLLFYLSRRDNQLKINGNRIELEEVSSVVRMLVPYSEVATVALNKKSRVSLHVFVASKHVVNSEKVLNKVKNELPAYMVPKSVHQIETLPLNQSGKVDVNKLKEILCYVL